MEKSRSLTNEEFVKVLQLEYLSQKLRAIIYDKAEFKKMSNDIASKKKEKILDLTTKFHLPCIFDSDLALQLFWENEFLNPCGKPNFQYSPFLKKGVSYWDSYYLFQAGQKISVREEKYKIFQNRPNEEVVVVHKNQGVLRIPYSEVKVELLYSLSIDILR